MTIYFAQIGEWIKIGFTGSEDVSKRIAQLQTGQPQKIVLLGTIPGERDAETGLHQELAISRGNGEWFARDEVSWIVSFLIENQHPWYYCRSRTICLKWQKAFEVTTATDVTAYDDVQGVDSTALSPTQAKALNMRIRNRRKQSGRDREWERQLLDNAALHPYVAAWKAVCAMQDRV